MWYFPDSFVSRFEVYICILVTLSQFYRDWFLEATPGRRNIIAIIELENTEFFLVCYITLWDLPLSPIEVVNWCKLKPPTRLIYFGCGESFWFQSVYMNVFILAMASGSMSRSTFYLVWLSWLQVSSSFLSKNVPIKRNTFSLSAVWTHLATGILRIPGTWLTSSSQRCLFWSSWLFLTCRLIQVCCEL